MSWIDTAVKCNTTLNETEGFRVVAAADRIALAYCDFRDGLTYMAFDNQAGADFVAGTQNNQQVLVGLPNWEWRMAVNNYFHDLAISGDGRVVALVFEDCSFPEDTWLVSSFDGGATVDSAPMTQLGSCGGVGQIDTDEPVCAVSLNGDINVAYLDHRNGASDAQNELYVTGMKFPCVEYDVVTQVVSARGIDPAQAANGNGAFLLVTQSGDVPGTDIGDWVFGTGMVNQFFVGINADPLTHAVLINFGSYRRISPQGAVTWTGIPPLEVLIGVPVHFAVGTVDPTTPIMASNFQSYSDPKRLR